MSNFNFDKTYNNATFTEKFFIRNDDLSLTAPELLKNNDTSLIISENVTYYKITNSMITSIPTIELEVKDNENVIANRLKNQNTRINLILTRNTENEIIEYNLTFLVKEFKITRYWKH